MATKIAPSELIKIARRVLKKIVDAATQTRRLRPALAEIALNSAVVSIVHLARRGRTGEKIVFQRSAGAWREDKPRLLAILLATMVAMPGVALGQIKIQVPEPGSEGIPVAVSPLEDADGTGLRMGEQFADVVARDLDISGLFRVIDRGAYIEGPAGLAPEQINFQNWSILGALALVKGRFMLQGENLTVEVRLFDVAQRRQLGGKRYRGDRRDLRRMAHRFADHILLLLTGELGPFDSKIAFVSRRGGGRAKEIYITDLSGVEIEQVTRDRTLSLGPNWNPMTTMLSLFSYKRGGPHPYVLDLSSGKTTRLSSLVGYGSRWSPDGNTLAVSLQQEGNPDLFLVSPQGQTIRRLTDHAGIDISPAWSPDGQEIAFVSGRGGAPQIYIMNVASGRVRRLTFSGNYNTSPAWSPKGDRIAYTSRAGGFHIVTISPSGGQPQEVAAGEDPSWSPDGRYLVFGYRGNLYIASSNGRSRKQLTAGEGDDTSPAWSARLQ